MATECRIARKMPNGMYRGVVCHYDGYPRHMVNTLLDFFNSGDLAEYLTTAHIKKIFCSQVEFIAPDNTVFEYKLPDFFEDRKNLLEQNAKSGPVLGVAHTYFFEDGKWWAHYPYRPDVEPVLLEEYSGDLIESMEKEVCTYNIEQMGWQKIDHPSAEGPSFQKGIFKCQVLMRGNVNALNAGVDPNITKLSVWTENGTQVYLGACDDMEDFFKIQELVCNE